MILTVPVPPYYIVRLTGGYTMQLLHRYVSPRYLLMHRYELAVGLRHQLLQHGVGRAGLDLGERGGGERIWGCRR